MILEEMYKKHQQMWLEIYQDQRTRTVKVGKINANLSNYREVHQQFASCFACEYALNQYSEINHIPLEECRDTLFCEDICPYCPLDFAERCEERYSLFRAFINESDLYKRANLALQIASIPLKDKSVYLKLLRNGFS